MDSVINRFLQKIQQLTPVKGKNVMLYFAPHQDDELLTLGIDACRTISAGTHQVHAVLFSDGSRSNMRLVIQNGKTCPHHKGIHQYPLEIPEFVAARDREFRSSCEAIGYKPENVHILPNRAIDGTLSVDALEETIAELLSHYPKQTTVCTISPFGGQSQHKDHAALGQAALNLYRKGTIQNLRLFVEPYCLDSCRESYPELPLTEIAADTGTVQKLSRAIASYSLWNPERGRYAIGYHSVWKVFQTFSENPICYFHTPDAL